MNARAVKKRVLRMRRVSFWGRRAYVSLRIPMSVYPEPCPVFIVPLDWKPEESLGACWRIPTLEAASDQRAYVSISKITSGTDPRKNPDKEEAFRFLECRETWTDRAGKVHEHWEWWEGVIRVGREYVDAEGNKQWELLKQINLPDDVVAAYRRESCWHAKYIQRMKSFEGDDRGFFARMWETQSWARATYGYVEGNHVVVTWAVKWFYSETLARFCASLGRLLKVAKREGIPVKLLGG